MAEYTELIKALRHCYEDDDACATCQRWLAHDEWGIKCKGRLISDAAAAIEDLEGFLAEAERDRDEYMERMEKEQKRVLELQDEVKRLKMHCADCEYGNSPWPEEPGHEPKLGEWIWDDKRCIYVCSVCGSPKVRENMDRQIIKEQAYCYSCGAKTEVQE